MSSRSILCRSVLVLAAFGVFAPAHADTDRRVDVSKLHNVDIYVIVPQKHVFVEFASPPQQVSQAPIGEEAVVFPILPVLIGTTIAYAIVDSLQNRENYDKAEAFSWPIHQAFDAFDANSVLKSGVDQAIGGAWSQPRVYALTTDDVKALLGNSSNKGADDIVIIQLFYSITPDYRALVVAASLDFYSKQLSGYKFNPYEPTSRYDWVRGPFMHKLCIYQTKLLDLPAKTPAVMEQLAEEVDHRVDPADTWVKLAEMQQKPMTTELRSERNIVLSHQADYFEQIRSIRDPNWQPDDARLMYAMMWAANGGIRLHQALAESSAALKYMFAAAVSLDGQPSSLPADRKLYFLKDVVYSVALGDKPDAGIVTLMYEK